MDRLSQTTMSGFEEESQPVVLSAIAGQLAFVMVFEVAVVRLGACVALRLWQFFEGSLRREGFMKESFCFVISGTPQQVSGGGGHQEDGILRQSHHGGQ